MIKNPIADIRIVVATDVQTIRKPAIAGAIILVPGHIPDNRATPLGIASLSIRLGYRALRAGWSKASTYPDKRARIIICHSLITPINVKRNKMNINMANRS